MNTGADLEAMAEELRGRWWHSIDIGHGIVTSGVKSERQLAAELDALDLPNLQGKTVLDIGAWDGFFSFAAEQRGAEKVTALDHYVWSIDFEAQQRYVADCRSSGQAPRPWHEVPEIWNPDRLPGKRCFDMARVALGSHVDSVVEDFMTTDLDRLGTFDIVLYLGVLYHMTDPLGALRRVAAVTRELAVIETEVMVATGYERFPLFQFYDSDGLAADPTNWWVPNKQALAALCRAAGFAHVDANPSPLRARTRLLGRGRVPRYRGVVRAWK